MYTVHLPVFEGPMDLLLHLIDKNKVDIYNIPIAEITDQYMEYLREAGEIDLGNLGDFLVMAAYLMRIKARMLLPAAAAVTEEEDTTPDPRAGLVQRILEYRLFKEAAAYLRQKHEGAVPRLYYRPAPETVQQAVPLAMDISDLVRAFLGLEQQGERREPLNLIVPRDDVSVEEQMQRLSRWLKKGSLVFQDILKRCTSTREKVAMFLALLELIHLGMAAAEQTDFHGRIIIKQPEVTSC